MWLCLFKEIGGSISSNMVTESNWGLPVSAGQSQGWTGHGPGFIDSVFWSCSI